MAQIAVLRALSPLQPPGFGGFHPLSYRVLGHVQHMLMHVLAYTLSNAHIGHLKMSEDPLPLPFPTPSFSPPAPKFSRVPSQIDARMSLIRAANNLWL